MSAEGKDGQMRAQGAGSGGSPSGEAGGLRMLLAERPEIKELVRGRMEQFPEYAAFLRSYGTEVLAAVGEGKSR